MTVLAAVDGEPGSTRVVERAVDLGNAYDDEVVIVHVLPETEYERRQDATPEFTLDRANDEARAIAQSVINEAFEAPPDRVRARGDVGDVAATLLDTAAAVDARYVVVGSRKRSPLGKTLFGSVTQAVMLDLDRPVVSVATDREHRNE
jgi:nucleotide-binding universal stress UspA family protein